MGKFKLNPAYTPTADQPKAIEGLAEGIESKQRFQTLLGATGTGKTFTMAATIERVQRPALVIAHNKTLAAQLCNEFREFFPDNAVEYFVSYYDYYQPEAYVPAQDLYIEKDSSINDEIDRLRHAATASLFARDDVIIVASVSCIYGIGSPQLYREQMQLFKVGDWIDRQDVFRKLVGMQYRRNDQNLARGAFRARGEVLEIYPAYAESAYRIQLFGDEIEAIQHFDPLTGEILDVIDHVSVWPASHYVVKEETMERAVDEIERELRNQVAHFEEHGKQLEAHRLQQRTRYDMEMMRELGFCPGIENYSRILDGRPPGSPPYTLIDYFPDDFVLFVDESHQTIPQLGGMYEGDYSRKSTLVDFGFRLPSAVDNRPLKFDEFLDRIGQMVLVSATPGPWERAESSNVVEQIVRPTGIVDPEVEVRETKNQIDDLMNEVRVRAERDERVLVTTLTKKMAEDLTEYLLEHGFRVRYLHSEIDTLERIQIIRELRLGEYDVLVGVNLLREGLDLPEVSLVAILDADKEGFLRGETSLIQTIGRAARNVDGRVLMYADKETDAMRKAISETDRRRAIQLAYNEEHGITAATVTKGISDMAEFLAMESNAPRRRRRRRERDGHEDTGGAGEAGDRAGGGDARGRRRPPLRGGRADPRRAQGAQGGPGRDPRLAANRTKPRSAVSYDPGVVQFARRGLRMRIGIVGAGRIGGNCAVQFAKGGHEVKLSGRDPSKLEPLAAEIGEAASVGTPAEAAEFGEVVVFAVPWDGFDDAVRPPAPWTARS